MINVAKIRTRIIDLHFDITLIDLHLDLNIFVHPHYMTKYWIVINNKSGVNHG